MLPGQNSRLYRNPVGIHSCSQGIGTHGYEAEHNVGAEPGDENHGISYILQKGASAVFTKEGLEQIQKNIRVYKENARVLMDAF